MIQARDVIINILSRLPPRSVIRYKTVCKAWRALIEDPYFAGIHTGRQSASSSDHADCNNTISFLLMGVQAVQPRYERKNLQYIKCYIEDLIYNDDVRKSSFYTNLITPLNHTTIFDRHNVYFGAHVIGTCNGLVCHRDHRKIVVYNPLTQEFANIVPYNADLTEPAVYFLHGFGYHPTTKEYKIVVIAYRLFGDIPVDTKAHVYTLGSGKWRIREAEIQHPISGSSVHFDGSLYWLCSKTEGVHICYFDLGDEELRMMPGPRASSQAVARSNSNYRYKLALLDWNLCVIEGVLNREMNVWVMKRGEENNGYSWTKDFIIPDHSLLHDTKANPILLTKGGKIMGLVCMEDGTRFIFCFDTKRANTLRSLPKFVGKNEAKSKHMPKWGAVLYTRSNVSLKALGEEDVKMVVPPAPSAGTSKDSKDRSCLNPIRCFFGCWLIHNSLKLRQKKPNSIRL